MKFDREKREELRSIKIDEYFDGTCAFCDSRNLNVRTSRLRRIQELGTTKVKIMVQLEVVTFKCGGCRGEFTPEHPDYPSKYEYSLNIIEHALLRYHYQNATGLTIAKELALLHNVEIPESTVYTWLHKLTPEFVKARVKNTDDELPATIKSITVDGTYVNLGRDVIGKKKDVESFSVTRLDDGRYLLMWWE